MANYKQTVKELAHLYADLAYESRFLPSLEAVPYLVVKANELKTSPFKLANDVHLYRNGFQFQKDLLEQRRKHG